MSTIRPSDTYQESGLFDDNELFNLLKVAPVQAVIRAVANLEISIRDLSGDIGLENTGDAQWTSVAKELVRRKALPEETTNALDSVLSLRNSIIHGPSDDQRAATLVVEGAIELIRTIRDTPREVHRAYKTLPIYTDESASFAYRAVKGLMVCSFDSPGTDSKVRVFPTQGWYEMGARVSWRWDVSQVVERAWYRHPATGLILKAWDRSALFVGNQLPETEAVARFWLQEPRAWSIRTTVTIESPDEMDNLRVALGAVDAKAEAGRVWRLWYTTDASNQRIAESVTVSGLRLALERAHVRAQLIETYVYPGASVQVGYLP